MAVNRSLQRGLHRIIHAAFALYTMVWASGCSCQTDPLRFPYDHGPHADVRNEWWYFTGTVQTVDGRTIGFETTLFKRFVSVRKGIAGVGHVAVSLPETREHLFSETVTKAPIDGMIPGFATLELNNFFCRFTDNGTIELAAQGTDVAVDLRLRPLTDPVLHGESGCIRMGDGVPSWYYSFPNLATTGTLRVRDETHIVVSGRTWMDHQWGNFTLFGMRWDWFSLRFDDGGSLMLFQFRDLRDRPASLTWTWCASSGEVFTGSGAAITASRIFEDNSRTCAYPVDWTISIPDISAVFFVRPLFDEQAISSDVTPDYWEGLCAVTGTIDGAGTSGFAYAELTGYCR
ncbi:MAG: hypothetical protein N3B18_04080 [Desulfobacterota bacterium]|nr:hypothetical protein [Thermodesulfobacteriota bacterium]